MPENPNEQPQLTQARKNELERRYNENISQGKQPYEGVNIQSRDELEWIIAQRDWSGILPVTNSNKIINLSRVRILNGVNLDSLYLRFANLSEAFVEAGVSMQKVVLECANLNGIEMQSSGYKAGKANETDGANLAHAFLAEADLSGARLWGVNLTGAELSRTDMRDTVMEFVNLHKAHLRSVDLRNTHATNTNFTDTNLRKADLRGAALLRSDFSDANLRESYMDGQTALVDLVIDERTQLGDIIWGEASLAHIDWTQIRILGEEKSIAQTIRRIHILKQEERARYLSLPMRKARHEERKKVSLNLTRNYREAARAYHTLATALSGQGLSPYASNFRLKEKRIERKALRNELSLQSWGNSQKWLTLRRWFVSWLLDILAGYGELLSRILGIYVGVILIFTGSYWLIAAFQLLGTMQKQLSLDQALIFSLLSFHGRGLSAGNFMSTDWITRLGAIEGVFGFFVEVILVATFSRRFLGN